VPGNLTDNEIKEMYVEFSKHGSVRRTATVCKRSMETVRKYRDKGDWIKRRKQTNEKAEELIDYDITKEKSKMLQAYRDIRKIIADKIKKKEYAPENLVTDLDRVIRGELLVAGEADLRIENIELSKLQKRYAGSNKSKDS